MHAPLIHAQLTTVIDTAYTSADQVNEEAVRALLPRLADSLDRPTIVFLQSAPRLVLNATAALTNVLETHRYYPHCIECGTRHLCRTIHRIGEIFTPVDLMDSPAHTDNAEAGQTPAGPVAGMSAGLAGAGTRSPWSNDERKSDFRPGSVPGVTEKSVVFGELPRTVGATN